MPPKTKFTKEEITAAALGLVREGKSATAREIAAALGSSARPIFSVFRSMEEVLQSAERAARDIYNGYVREGLGESLAFRGVGRAYLRFSREEPLLFQMLFMQRHGENLEEILPVIDENYGAILQSIVGAYNLEESAARKIYNHLWLYTHGIASLIATGSCSLAEHETDEMLTEVFTALVSVIKRGKT